VRGERVQALHPVRHPPGARSARRQRLDALLKQYLDGQLSEAEYNEKRGKILGE